MIVKVEAKNSNELGTSASVKVAMWPGVRIDKERKRVKARRCQLRVLVKYMKGLESPWGGKSNFI